MNKQIQKPRVSVPRHVAVVMDGNGRWAKKRFLPRVAGHRQGVEAVRKVIQSAFKAGVHHLTLFAFSSENWNRPREEVEALMGLFLVSLQKEIPQLEKANIRVRLIGNLEAFSSTLQEKIRQAHEITAHCTGMTLNICVSYGGRWDIVEACRSIMNAGVDPKTLNEEVFGQHVQLADAGDVDLLIRTSGESRISNFLLWQCAYSEFYFTPVLWPDFDEAEFNRALEWYANRERRFGKTSEQLS